MFERIECVRRWLEDDESKFIFDKKIQFNKMKDYQNIYEIIDNYIPEFKERKYYPGKEMELVSRIKEGGKKVIIYGTGYYGRKVLELCIRNQCDVRFFCDSNPNKWGKTIEQYPILSIDELKTMSDINEYVIIISFKTGCSEMESKLQDEIPRTAIVKWIDYSSTSLEKQYFEKEIINLSQDEVFVDAGAFDMGTSNLFIQKMNELGHEYKMIYAFEPDKKNYEKCKKKIESEGYKKIDIICAGLWSKNDQMSFVESGTGSSAITDNKAASDCISVVSLDSYIDGEVTFIKMDIEGAEREALEGARNIIEKYKPKLAISIYHKAEDMWEIPELIKSIVPEYKLYIRHYGNSEYETILYAV